MASKLRAIYRARKEERDNKPYKAHKRYDDSESWYRTAAVVLRMKADPIDYIEAQFRFCKSTLMANTLHGATAQKRYRRLLAIRSQTQEDTVEVKNNPMPRHADLAALIADFWHDLDYHCGSHNLTDKHVSDTILRMRLRYDPLVVMLLCPTPEFKEVFGEDAKARLDEAPHLKIAAREMNLGAALDYLYE